MDHDGGFDCNSGRPVPASRWDGRRLGYGAVNSADDSGLFLLEADDARQLKTVVSSLATVVPGLSERAFLGLAPQLAALPSGTPIDRRAGRNCWRVALSASNPRALWEGLSQVSAWLNEGRRQAMDPRTGVCLAHTLRRPRIAFVFPGQAAPVSFDGGVWARRYPAVAGVFAHPSLPVSGSIDDTAVVQPYGLAAQLAGLKVLEGYGLRADLALGHSLGELTALHWAGAFDGDTLLRLGTERGRVMGRTVRGAMCHIGAPISELYWVMEPNPKVVVSCINGPDSTVLSGPVAAIEAVAARARRRGWKATRLRVRGAFHSPLIRPAANALADALSAYRFQPLRGRVVSSTTASWLSTGLDIKAHLIEHMIHPVRFIEAMDKVAGAADLCIEVGSGSLLGGLAIGWLDLPVLSTEVAGDGVDSLMHALAAAYVLGADVDRQALAGGRYRHPSTGADSAPAAEGRPQGASGAGQACVTALGKGSGHCLRSDATL